MQADSSSGISASDFENFCADNPSLRAELSAQGEITIMAPGGGESSCQSADVCMQLGVWAKIDRRGKAFDSSAAFVLPTGAILAPDAAWVSNLKPNPFPVLNAADSSAWSPTSLSKCSHPPTAAPPSN